ncbi:ABC transporter ATP-binding protein, partial [Marinovum algicola]|uniref:ABC transporter ATP-binding protein n=1 Tax=Marinovum algicola TaxID=42444 RepID=UPI0024BAF8E4
MGERMMQNAALKIVEEPQTMTNTEVGRIDVENAAVTFKGPKGKKIEALAPTDLVIDPGSFVSLIGPSGCGKSTLLKGVAGYMAPVEGTMKLNGREITEPGPDRVMVFQEFDQLLPWKTVKQNITFALLNGKKCASRAEADDVAMEYIKKVKLERFEDTYPHMLSGGMKQKLGLCCALIHDPEILVLDEPTTGVDPLSRQQFWQLIEHIRQSQTCMTVLVATAYMDEAARFDHLVAMNDGKILATGPADEILSRTGT